MTPWWEAACIDQATAVAQPRAVAYYRHSAQDRQENSIPIQREQVREWAEKRGLGLAFQQMYRASCEQAKEVVHDRIRQQIPDVMPYSDFLVLDRKMTVSVQPAVPIPCGYAAYWPFRPDRRHVIDITLGVLLSDPEELEILGYVALPRWLAGYHTLRIDSASVRTELFGRKPTVKSVCRHDYRLHEAAQREFGTWRQALAAAGLDLSRARMGTTKPQRLTRRQVIEALRAWSAAGRSLQWCDICLENRALAAAARARFRNWRAVTAIVAGTADMTTSVNSYDSDQQCVIGRIQQRQRDGKSVTYRVVRKSDPSLLSDALKHFGGWRRARAAAAEPAQTVDDREEHSSPR